MLESSKSPFISAIYKEAKPGGFSPDESTLPARKEVALPIGGSQFALAIFTCNRNQQMHFLWISGQMSAAGQQDSWHDRRDSKLLTLPTDRWHGACR